MNLGGIILAGGKSKRMGTDKGSLKIAKKKMVSYISETLTGVGIQDIQLITNKPELYRDFEGTIHKDLIEDVGPLGGIYTGLYYAKHRNNLVIACDTPWIDKEVLQVLIDEFRSPVSVVSHASMIHPLIGIYSIDVLDLLQVQIDIEDYRMTEFVKRVEGRTIRLEDRLSDDKSMALFNINTPRDLEDFKTQAGIQ